MAGLDWAVLYPRVNCNHEQAHMVGSVEDFLVGESKNVGLGAREVIVGVSNCAKGTWVVCEEVVSKKREKHDNRYGSEVACWGHFTVTPCPLNFWKGQQHKRQRWHHLKDPVGQSGEVGVQ